MKKLLLVRHAKAEILQIGNSDFDRPLISRGIVNAEEMALRLYNKRIIPDLLVSSPALRAFTTAQLFSNQFQSTPILEIDHIYDGSMLDLLNIINQLDNRYDFVALFGHNPGISDLLNYLTNDNLVMATCGVAVVNFLVEDWSLVSMGIGELLLYDYPKNPNI